MCSKDMDVTLNQRIQASVLAHYLETSRPATLKEIADRLVGVSLTSAQLRKHVSAGVPGCVKTRVSLGSPGTHRIVEALEPEGELLGRVLVFLKKRSLRFAVVVRPIVAVG